jgi:hypothetical protein
MSFQPKTFALLGIDGLPVEAEVDVSPAGLPKSVLVGLPEKVMRALIVAAASSDTAARTLP